MGKKKMLMRKFGSIAIVNNTFIGGVASVINTPALLAAKLENYPSGAAFSENDIQNFIIVGDDIECYIGVDYTVRFLGVGLGLPVVTYYRDYSTKLKNIGTQAFYGSNLIEGYFPSAINISTGAFDSNVVGSVNKLKSLYIPNVLTIGNTVGNDNVFRSGNLNDGNIYANPSLQTVNAGGVEGDLAYLETGNTVTYVTNFDKPNPVTDLSVNAVYATAIKLDWSVPTSTNAIYFYEVYVDGVFYKNSSTNEILIGGLTNLQMYNFSVIAVDIFYNKSEMSNVVTQQINGVGREWLDNVISYYKFENNVLDSIGTNDGIATDITYASGQVGNAGVFNGSSSEVLIGNSSDFNINNDSTISMLIYLTSVSAKQCPFEYGTYTSWGTMNIQVGGEIRFYHTPNSGGSFLIFESVAKVPLNQWTHIVLVRDYTNGILKWYFNGVEVASMLTNETQAKQSTGNALIGSGYAGKVNGSIDDTPIFNKALTQSEITEIYNIHNAGFPLI